MHIKRRNMLIQVLLMIVTFGIYGLYWFYSTATELKAIAKDEAASPALWTVLLFVPFVSLFAFYKYGELYEKASSDKMNKWLVFILWLAFSPAVWIIAQMELNKRAETMPSIKQAA